MKCLSVRQPWASLIVKGVKNVENRTWRTWYLGPLLIHASTTYDKHGEDLFLDSGRFPDVRIPEETILGAIIGKVEMIGCVEKHYSPWFFGPYAFVFDQDILPPVEFKKPIQYKGTLGLFEVPDEIVKEALRVR